MFFHRKLLLLPLRLPKQIQGTGSQGMGPGAEPRPPEEAYETTKGPAPQGPIRLASQGPDLQCLR